MLTKRPAFRANVALGRPCVLPITNPAALGTLAALPFMTFVAGFATLRAFTPVPNVGVYAAVWPMAQARVFPGLMKSKEA